MAWSDKPSNPNWRDDPSTPNQIGTIEKMLVKLKRFAKIPNTKGECSDLIGQLKAELGYTDDKPSSTSTISWGAVMQQFQKDNPSNDMVNAKAYMDVFQYLMCRYTVSALPQPKQYTPPTQSNQSDDLDKFRDEASSTDEDKPF